MSRRRRKALRDMALLQLSMVAVVAAAATENPAAVVQGGIYTCSDDRGRRITSDRPIADCSAKEQRILNKDGSLKVVQPPTLTVDERADADARERAATEARAAQADAVRRDRNLAQRYRTQDAHNAARMAALDSVRSAMKLSETRLVDLARERKPLNDEAEFYKGKPLPLKLKSQIDANDAAAEAQRSVALSQEAELERITRLYDAELARLKRLWAGAPAGSLGPLPPAALPVAKNKAAVPH